jgi:uncharacterized DUF497 family protein
VNLRFHYGNLEKHTVSTEEVEEAFNDPRKILRASAGAYWLVAKTFAGRYLEIGFAKEPDDNAFVFHAMDAKPYQRRQYKTRAK